MPFHSRLLGRNWWDTWDYPERLMDQEFGLGFRDDDFFGGRHFGMGPGHFHHHPRHHPRRHGHFSQFSACPRRPGKGVSQVISKPDKFQIFLDVRQFGPEEIEVKTVDDSVVVHGKHEEKMDEHGFVSREFTRRYVLPEGVEPETVVSSLSTSEGVLLIEAPRKQPQQAVGNERIIPIKLQDEAESTEPVKPRDSKSQEDGGTMVID